MLEISLIMVLLSGLYGYYLRLREFNNLPHIQKIAKDNFNLLSDGMSLSEVQDKLNKKGTRVNNSIYRWYFGDSIVAKKGKEIISVSEFINNSSYKEGYRLIKTPAFINVLFVDNKLVKKECIGLD